MGKFYGKAFRILGFDERKGRWVVEQEFYGNCRVNQLHDGFLPFPSVFFTELCSCIV